MKIGLLPGSYNPIHIGHLILAEYLLNNFDFDQVWLIISPQNPLKKKASLVDLEHRMKMVNLSIGDSKSLLGSDIEFHLPFPSYTIDTLDFLKSKYPKDIFNLIIGADNYQNLSKWKSHQRLEDENSIYVYPRKGYPLTQNRKSNHFLVNEAPEIEISSSFIRKNLQENKSIRYLVVDKVLEYIQTYQLYI